ncbi:MAG: hypothetical protein ACYS8Z_16780 [Planctomycetota bacterium]|jgi:hypothetical protein
MANNNFNEFKWAQEELPVIKRFFERIAPVLVEFASDHNLKLEKYYHDGPTWDFLFRHQAGGTCYIEIRKCDDEGVKICGDWSVYQYDEGLGYNKHTQLIDCSIAENELRTGLKDMLRLVLSWKRDDLEIISKRGAGVKEQVDEEVFYEYENSLPLAKY